MSSLAIEFENVGKVYSSRWPGRPSVRALDHVSFSVAQGEVFGLLGPNRAGKTTLTKILLSLCRPTTGYVRRFGWPAWHRASLARVGYMHEHQAFAQYLTAESLLWSYGSLTHLPSQTLAVRIPTILEQVGLSDRSRESIGGFSKGMKQRLSLAQALLNDPDLLVLDEPSEGMDILARRMMHEVIEAQRAKGGTTLLVSHSVADIEALCDRAAILVEGQLIQVTSLDDLIDGSEGSRSLEDVLAEVYRKAVA